MAIYYTTREGGFIYRMKRKIRHSKLLKMVKRGKHPYHKVFSLFFTRGNKIRRVWDKGIHGYRDYHPIRIGKIKPEYRDL
jgi:hypothetical protein